MSYVPAASAPKATLTAIAWRRGDDSSWVAVITPLPSGTERVYRVENRVRRTAYFTFAHESLSVTVRLNTGFIAVESASCTK